MAIFYKITGALSCYKKSPPARKLSAQWGGGVDASGVVGMALGVWWDGYFSTLRIELVKRVRSPRSAITSSND
jgi:hypothetical protein